MAVLIAILIFDLIWGLIQFLRRHQLHRIFNLYIISVSVVVFYNTISTLYPGPSTQIDGHWIHLRELGKLAAALGIVFYCYLGCDDAGYVSKHLSA
jgi:hypothetical protein